MPIIKTALNYTQASQTNFSDSASITVTAAAEVTLVRWGHFVPTGTQFVEVNATIGWEGADFDEIIEFRIYQNDTLVFTADDSADDIEENNDVLTTFKAILTSPVNQHNVYELRAILTQVEFIGRTATIEGPLTLNTISYGTP